ncbi:MAG TPA: porin, partial [Sulfurimonas autotrophica]|nr:porin [Sulfurimonas autotrophica]
NIGVAYEISGITVGAVYKSRIDMDYKDQFSNAMAGFGIAYTNTDLSSPAEIGVGASYTVDEHTVALDYKRIQWSDAKGYKDFKWDDQNVITLGYEYKTKEWSARAGYNYASSPIQNLAPGSLSAPAGSTFAGDYAGLLNTFNLLGFPGIVESHYAVGGSYNISKQVSVDVAFTYAPEVTETFKNFAGLDITTKHSQTGVSAQLTFDF